MSDMTITIEVFQGEEDTIDTIITTEDEVSRNPVERNFTKQELHEYMNSVWDYLGSEADRLTLNIHWKY